MKDHNVHSNGLGRIPSVSLYGLNENLAVPTSSKGTSYLACGIRESHPFLRNFRTFVDQAFFSKGLMPILPLGANSPTVRILNLNYYPTEIANEKPILRRKGRALAAKFDGSDLYPRYKDFAWTTEFPLERICISELGLKDFRKNGKLVRTGYRDIACAPLPGVSKDTVAEIAAEQSMEQFEKAYKTRPRNFPVYPLLIPSTPTLGTVTHILSE